MKKRRNGGGGLDGAQVLLDSAVVTTHQ